jgi:D-sedoheptulose 7-phosphate isomerase
VLLFCEKTNGFWNRKGEMMRYIKILQEKMESLQCDIQGERFSYENFVDKMRDIFIDLRDKHKTTYFIGNGGSAGIAIHMTADYLKSVKIRTHSMHDAAILTCLGNDFGYEYVFSKQVEIIAKKGDVLVAISSSGNSPNIIRAVEMAKRRGCTIISFSGFEEDNKLRQLGDYNIYISCMEYGIVESIHNMILQHIVDEIYFFDKNRVSEV